MSHTITIRDGTLADEAHILDLFDSAIEYLPTIGSGDQWGPQLFSKQQSRQEGLSRIVTASVENQKNASPGDLFDMSRDNIPHARILVAESTPTTSGGAVVGQKGVEKGEEEDGEAPAVRVAGLAYQDFVPPNMAANEQYRPSADMINAREGKFVYVWVLVSNFRVDAERRKGGGSALLGRTIELAKAHGKKWVYVDCWTGNDRKLVQYYERQGFSLVKDFLFEKPDGSMWPGSLLELDVEKYNG
ncbi:hypothetical protein Micbo1qcDRAFT_167470 [Microdochium bolleyi]|uniref:N-acetyltransferase domain-containing protein n=1 Tax=Microdochium bolleyi TaxID=196109 RepID=A0A136IR98_9PEZI|nr:hypothetical protein Micbo1qcDRAFT_167470 [Microdochium bolleyi]